MFLVILLAISLSIDALGIGIAYGVRGISIPLTTKLILTGESLLLMGLSLLAGKHLTLFLSNGLANHIGVLLLLVMGIWLCFQSFMKERKEKNSLSPAMEMIRTPSSCDRDNSARLDPSEAVYLGFVLSIDSLGAGIGAGAAGISFLALPICIALFQLFFITIGALCGKRLSKKSTLKENLWSAISGTLLIVIALLRLFF